MDDEKRKALLSGVTNPVQAAPLMEQKPGPIQEIGKTVLDTTINKGIENAFTAGLGTPATATTPAVAGGVGPAAAAGGPYVLAALAAGKLFGLYSHGGKIKGPLYADEGTEVENIFPKVKPPKGKKYFYDPDKEPYKPKGKPYRVPKGELESFEQGYDENKLRYLNSGDTVTERKDQGAFPNIEYPQRQLPPFKFPRDLNNRQYPMRKNPELGPLPENAKGNYPQFQGPISKIKYKSEGGEVTEIDYGLK